jgi:uncharacterized protein YjiS (DUF1127 family)
MNILRALRERAGRARAIQVLNQLDDRILRDIGLERDQLGLMTRRTFGRLQDLGR